MVFEILLFFQFYVFQLIFVDVLLLKNLQTRKPVPMSSETDFLWTDYKTFSRQNEFSFQPF